MIKSFCILSAENAGRWAEWPDFGINLTRRGLWGLGSVGNIYNGFNDTVNSPCIAAMNFCSDAFKCRFFTSLRMTMLRNILVYIFYIGVLRRFIVIYYV